DRSGVVQAVFSPSDNELREAADKLRPEWVVRLKGKVKARPEKMFNPEIPTGKVEIEPLELEILNEAETMPIAIDTDGYEIGEESRMTYRYLDLRRPRLLKNISKRHETVLFMRN
ncbi:MAG: OB-fold nucleic acid binding domain-containing protein, partial [Patescibacteria group bacterium]